MQIAGRGYNTVNQITNNSLIHCSFLCLKKGGREGVGRWEEQGTITDRLVEKCDVDHRNGGKAQEHRTNKNKGHAKKQVECLMCWTRAKRQ